MRHKKLLLLLAGLSYSVVKAQERIPSKLVEADVPNVTEALRGSANPRYKVLKWFTPIYLQPADTASGHPALRLWPNTKVYLREYVADGFLIDFTGSDRRYYLPAKSIMALPTFVEI